MVLKTTVLVNLLIAVMTEGDMLMIGMMMEAANTAGGGGGGKKGALWPN